MSMIGNRWLPRSSNLGAKQKEEPRDPNRGDYSSRAEPDSSPCGLDFLFPGEPSTASYRNLLLAGTLGWFLSAALLAACKKNG